MSSDEAGGAAGHDDESHEEVVYDLSDWDAELRATLGRLLDGEGVAHRWDQPASLASWMTPGAVSGPASPANVSDLLVVAGRHADVVEELIDELDHPDALAPEDDDGDDAGAEVLSSLYVAADVLCGAPGHAQGAEELFEAARAAGEVAAPYGLDPATWAELRGLAAALAQRLREGADEEVIAGAAGTLRQAVHPLV